SRFRISAPRGSDSVSVTQRLLRPTSAHQSETPSFSQPIERRPSPRGCSTLTTSAPKSPIIVAITGPAKSVAQSTTRSPSRGRCFSFVLIGQPLADERWRGRGGTGGFPLRVEERGSRRKHGFPPREQAGGER